MDDIMEEAEGSQYYADYITRTYDVEKAGERDCVECAEKVVKALAHYFNVSEENEIAHLEGEHFDEYRGIAAVSVNGVVEEDEDVEHNEFSQKCDLLIRYVFLAGSGFADFPVVFQLAFNCIPWNKAENSEASHIEQYADGYADGENPFPVLANLHVSNEEDGKEG